MRKMSKCAAKAVGRQQKYYALHFQREGIVLQPYPSNQKKQKMYFPVVSFLMELNRNQIALPIFGHFHER